MKKIFDVCLAIVIMLLPNFSIYAATFSQNINSEYKYAEISREQKMSVSHQEIVDAYQIPTDKIESMTTEELLSAYLNYPLLGDMFAYNTTEMGFHALRKQCNALEELLSRKDTGEEILNRYNAVELLDSNNADSASFENFFEPSALEILAAQPEIVANTDADTYALLRSAIYEKCTEKSEEVYSATKDMYYSTKKEVSEINQFENDKQSMIMSISKSDFNWNHTVKTPKKSSVTVGVLKAGKELTSNEKAQLKKYIASQYPGASYISPATKKYNCHSFAWYRQSSSNGYWMNDPSKYMRDGSYKKHGFKVGNIIYYKGIHSGVISGVHVGYAGCYVKS